jgi:hypothetical protein
MKTSRLLSFVCVLFLALTVQGQTVVLRGKMIDKKTGEFLPFATINNQNNTIATATNGKGEFVIKFHNPSPTDMIVFSFIGYTSARLPLVNVSDKPIVIELEPTAFLLNEVAIVAVFSSEDTLKKAIRLIPQNYPAVPLLLESFYRETLQENKTKTYRLYTEGVLQYYKPSYQDLTSEDQVRVLKGRKKKLPYGGLLPIVNGPRIGAIVDILKSREFMLHPTRFAAYRLRFTGVTSINGEQVYVIDFSPKSSYTSRAYFSGQIYLRTSDLAFIRAEYELAPQGLAAANQGNTMLSVTFRKYTVSYAQFQGRWCLQNGSIRNHFLHVATGDTLTSTTLFSVTRRQSEGVSRFKAREIVTDEQTFVEKTEFSDEDFWQEYNFIKEDTK